MVGFDFRALSCRTPDRCAAAPSPNLFSMLPYDNARSMVYGQPVSKGARVGRIALPDKDVRAMRSAFQVPGDEVTDAGGRLQTSFSTTRGRMSGVA